jgi:hypothetical protein
MDDPQQHLKAALAEHLNWHGARLSFLAHFLLALIKVRSVNLAELATGFGGKAQVASHYKRLQRFFRSFILDYNVLARLLIRLVPVGEGPWYLTLDRTNWQFGKADLNLLVLGIAYQGIALPLVWTVLDKAILGSPFKRSSLVLDRSGLPGVGALAGCLFVRPRPLATQTHVEPRAPSCKLPVKELRLNGDPTTAIMHSVFLCTVTCCWAV